MEKKMVINGMKCMHCKARAEQALKSVEGVLNAEADLETKTASILMERDIEDSVLMNAVKEKGFEPVKVL